MRRGCQKRHNQEAKPAFQFKRCKTKLLGHEDMALVWLTLVANGKNSNNDNTAPMPAS